MKLETRAIRSGIVYPSLFHISAFNDGLRELGGDILSGLVVKTSADSEPPVSFPLFSYLTKKVIVLRRQGGIA